MKYRIDDEGQYFEMMIKKGEHQFCSFLIDIEPLGVDVAYNLAVQVQAMVFNALGDGGGAPHID
jgi:c-di-GMP-binding flagellar brake protein YcgR